MAKKTYSLDLNGATNGNCVLTSGLASSPVPWDDNAGHIQSELNSYALGGVTGWTVSGTGPFIIEQPETAGNFELQVIQGSLDTTPSLTVTQEWLPSVNLSVDDADILEPSGAATVTFGIPAVHTAAVTVAFTIGGTASAPADYTASTASPVSIASGESIASLVITVADDFATESNETVIVSLGAITGGEAGTASTVTITIGDNDYAFDAGRQFMLMGVG